jgi:hypothetical protein
LKKALKAIALFLLFAAVFFGLIQLVPYGRDHTNPPVIQEPDWAFPEIRELTVRACFNCHSNETVWPWYSNIAPASWLVQRDVSEAREELNFSEWGRQDVELKEISEHILNHEMPPAQYLLLHPEARLTEDERNRLVSGLYLSLHP